MRSLTALVLILLLAAPVLAQDGMSSQEQTENYGKLFGYVCGVIAAGLILLGGVQIVKGFLAESARGKKTGIMREEILDKSPRKDPKRYLGEKVPDWKVANREAATKSVLRFLAGGDEVFVR